MKLNPGVLLITFGSVATFLSFGDEPRSNTNTNTDTNTAQPEDWVAEVVTIKYERATDMAAALNDLTTHYHGFGTNLLASRRDALKVLTNAWVNVSPQFKELNSRRGMKAGSAPVTSGNEGIIADERTNSVLIRASKRDLQVLKEAIAKLDIAREEILFEAVLFEITLSGTNTPETICFDGPVSDLHAAAASGQSGYAKAFAPLDGTETNFDAMITRWASLSGARIRQHPRIQTSDGVAASLFVGEDSSGIRLEDHRHSLNELLGFTLDISPTITPERKLRLSIGQTIEKYAGSTNIAKVGNVAITSRQSLQTQVTVADRQTIVLAGPVEQTQDKPSRGVPVLKNTPWLGGLFRNHPRKRQVETLLAIRATLLPQNHARTSQEDQGPAVATNHQVERLAPSSIQIQNSKSNFKNLLAPLSSPDRFS